MKPCDVAEFTRVLSRVGALYGKPINKSLVETYWTALQGFDLADIRQALGEHSLHPDAGKFMPRPSDVLRVLQGDSQTQALQAWSKVAKAIREIGRYSSVVFDDPVIHAVIADMGGWVSLCDVRVDHLPFREKDFIARYAGYVGRPPAQYPKALTGLLEHQNLLAGHKAEPPVCIGNPQKALAVYAQGQIAGHAYTTLPRHLTEEKISVFPHPNLENLL